MERVASWLIWGSVLLCASPLVAEKISLDRLSSYLDGLKTVEAKFTQISSDGSFSTGALFIKRPGRIRFEYDPPNDALVLASGGQLAIFDPKGNAGPESYPLNKTPLSLILDDKIDLKRNKLVAGHNFDGTSTILTVQDPENPERGKMALVFTPDGPQLRQWVIRDQNGEETVVVLNDMATGKKLNDAMFNIQLNKNERNK